MKKAVIYLVNKNVNSLAEEEIQIRTHVAKIPEVKITDVYLEETLEDREQLIVRLCEKIDKDEVQIILTNSFAFAFSGKPSIGLLANRINEKDIDVLVGSKIPFVNNKKYFPRD